MCIILCGRSCSRSIWWNGLPAAISQSVSLACGYVEITLVMIVVVA